MENKTRRMDSSPKEEENPLRAALEAISNLAKDENFLMEENSDGAESEDDDTPKSEVDVEDFSGEVEDEPEPEAGAGESEAQPKSGNYSSAFDETPLGASSASNNRFLEKILEPSSDLETHSLYPCPTCGRTFLRAALERHIKICEKVSTKKSPALKQRTSPATATRIPSAANSSSVKKKAVVRPEDELKKCPHCERTFGPKPFDRHVAWCEEKAKRLQDSPNKDLLALAKLHARTGYRPKTPAGKSEGSPSRKSSLIGSVYSESPQPFGDWSRGHSLSRSESRSSRHSRKSPDRRPDISFLGTKDHTKETEETNFIRAITGRGSIRKGPAPTKASQLRELSKKSPGSSEVSPPTRGVLNPQPSPVMTRSLHVAPTTAPSTPNGHALPNHGFRAVVKPTVVRPGFKTESCTPSSNYRREPEGIEHELPGTIGTYDHSAQYDPYQSAARQMQELLFGNVGAPAPAVDANLRPSTNSAFEKYVPSTADINAKLNAKSNFLDVNNGDYMSLPRMKGGWELPGRSHQVNFSPMVASMTTAPSRVMSNSAYATTGRAKSPKVARFCHECGNPFALPNIRFCCECGVKRLYC